MTHEKCPVPSETFSLSLRVALWIVPRSSGRPRPPRPPSPLSILHRDSPRRSERGEALRTNANGQTSHGVSDLRIGRDQMLHRGVASEAAHAHESNFRNAKFDLSMISPLKIAHSNPSL